MRIDAYSHVVPKTYYEDLGKVYQAPAYKRHPDTAGLWDYERRLDHMDKFGIDKQIIALGGPHLWPGIDKYTNEATIQQLVRQANNEVREIADDYPDYFIPIGTLPRLDENMVDEFKRCINDLDMAGIQIYSNYEGEPIDHELLHPVYEMAENQDIPIWIHPQVHDWYDWTHEYGLDLSMGWLFDTTLAVCRLVFSGLLERYPDLDVIQHHGGGLIPHFMERTKLFYEGTTDDQDGTFSHDIFEDNIEPLTKPVDEYFKQVYADSVLYGSDPALKTVYEEYGADQMVFATDYPYGGEEGEDFMGSNARSMDELNISKTERRKIESGNLISLIE